MVLNLNKKIKKMEKQNGLKYIKML